MSEEMEEFIEQHTMYRNGLKQGIEKGIQENKREIVLNMFNNNLSLEMIANCTNLTLEEIEKIIKENNNN